jgi:hypothetical protein
MAETQRPTPDLLARLHKTLADVQRVLAATRLLRAAKVKTGRVSPLQGLHDARSLLQDAIRQLDVIIDQEERQS